MAELKINYLGFFEIIKLIQKEWRMQELYNIFSAFFNCSAYFVLKFTSAFLKNSWNNKKILRKENFNSFILSFIQNSYIRLRRAIQLVKNFYKNFREKE